MLYSTHGQLMVYAPAKLWPKQHRGVQLVWRPWYQGVCKTLIRGFKSHRRLLNKGV